MPTAVPTVVHIGNDQLNGPVPIVQNVPPFLWSSFRAWPQLMRPVPSTATGTVPGSPAYVPWFDGTANGGAGAFGVYHHMSGIVAGFNGGTWYAGATGGIGADATYMQLLPEVWPGAPYFKAVKRAFTGGITTGWKPPSGNDIVNFLAEWNAEVVPAAAALDQTLDVKLIIIDACVEDLRTGWATAGLTYEADLTALIALLRTTFSAPQAKVLLVTPAPQIYQVTSPGGAISVRAIHTRLARTLDGVGVVDMNGAIYAPPSGALGSGNIDPTADQKCYSTEDYLTQGAKIVAAFKALLNPIVTTPGRGLPCYWMVGDSIGVGPLSPVLVALSGQGSLLGPYPGTVRQNQFVLNAAAHQIQLYDPLLNANTAGTITSNVGPELTITAELARKHPGGFLLVKMAVNASALKGPTAPGGLWNKGADEHYATFLELIQEANTLVSTQPSIRRIPDWRGGFVLLGDNDTYQDGDGDLFAAELPQFIADLREDTSTRTGGKLLPVVVHRIHASSVLGLPAERAAVRAAVEAMQDEIEQTRYVNMDDQELDRGDNIHDGMEAVLARGRRLVAALAEIDLDLGTSEGAGDDEGTDDAGAESNDGAAESDADAASDMAAVEDAFLESPDVKSFTVNGRTTERRSISEMIELLEYQRAAAARRAGRGQTLVSFE